MSHFFAMGGYAAFVWPAYAVSILGIGASILLTWREYRHARDRLAEIESEVEAKVGEQR
jgi:heme exporter protein D